MQKISPFLWFDDNAEEAVNFYTSIFKDSKVTKTLRHNETSAKESGRPAGSILTISFQIEGQEFTAINGGPYFKFTEAVSFVVNCETQDEIDYFWERLSEGGDEDAQECGWLKDKYGLSWQIVPGELYAMLDEPESEKTQKVMQALHTMKKIDLSALRKAYQQ